MTLLYVQLSAIIHLILVSQASIIDAGEDDQLAAAIRASLAEEKKTKNGNKNSKSKRSKRLPVELSDDDDSDVDVLDSDEFESDFCTDGDSNLSAPPTKRANGENGKSELTIYIMNFLLM